MPHKVGDAQSLKKTKESIAYYENLIVNIKAVQRGDSNSIKMGMEAIRELEFDAMSQKDTFLKTGDPIGMAKAHGFQRMQEAYQTVITMFEAPNSMIDTYQEEIKKLHEYLDRYDPKQSSS